MLKRKPELHSIEDVKNRRQIFFNFLSNLTNEFTALQKRHRFAKLSDEGFATLQMALVHTAREAQQYQLSLLYQSAVTLECCIRDILQSENNNRIELRFELKRAFDSFATAARRAHAREEEEQINGAASIAEGSVPVVLVIDGDHWAHRLVDRAIGRRCMVVSAYNGKAAIETLKTLRPDLIVMDINLPDLKGSELLPQLKALPVISAIPIVVSSSDNDDRAVVSGLVGGAIDYIVKGISLPDMRDRLLETLDHGRVRQS